MEKNYMEKKVISKLKELTKNKNVGLVNRGNTAIFVSFMSVKKLNELNEKIESPISKKDTILIQDQGGWMFYEKFCKKAGLKVLTLKTKDGLIDVSKIDENILDSVLAIIYTQPSGYALWQNAKEIYDFFLKKGIFVIQDSSGSVGLNSSESKYYDFSIGSFSEGKPIDVGHGGFIFWNNDDFTGVVHEVINGLSKEYMFDYSKSKELLAKIDLVKERYKLLHSLCKKVVKELSKFEILWDRGIVVIVKYKNPSEMNEIIGYCNENGFEYTLCPREIRVMQNAVSIEVKRRVE